MWPGYHIDKPTRAHLGTHTRERGDNAVRLVTHHHEVDTTHAKTSPPRACYRDRLAGIAPGGRAYTASHNHQWTRYERQTSAAPERQRRHRHLRCRRIHGRARTLLLHRTAVAFGGTIGSVGGAPYRIPGQVRHDHAVWRCGHAGLLARG